MNLAFDLITVLSYLHPGSNYPYEVNLNHTDNVNLSNPGFNEHIVSHNTLGNMGRTRCTKYTEVVVCCALSSISPPS